MTSLENLLLKASQVIGREVEVVKTNDGKYIVLFMSLSHSPPPKGDTTEEAVEKFLEWYQGLNITLPEEEEGTQNE